ncbi:MAG: metallophosphoesterase [Clostridia bacterium]|nr:metallophosphoesterase [Clostridia bacterium]
MIYITGDTHGERERFELLGEYGEPDWTADDYLIVCGDFGYIFRNDARENAFLDALAGKPYMICFVDGNHENFPAVSGYPTEVWKGGRVHRIRQNLVHLMRGQVYTIGGSVFFTMGGAYSIDRAFRAEGVSYWKEELPDNSEYREASVNLKEHGFAVDYILTHTAPREIIRRMGEYPDAHDAELTGFLEWIMHETKFRKWFFGHWHLDREIGDRFRALYYDVVQITTAAGGKTGEDRQRAGAP